MSPLPPREIKLYRFNASDGLFWRSRERGDKKTPAEANGMICQDEAEFRKIAESLDDCERNCTKE